MKYVSDLPAKPLVDFMDSIHTNGPVGSTMTVDDLTSYMTFIYNMMGPLQKVGYDSTQLSMEFIHETAVSSGAFKEKSIEGLSGKPMIDAMLYNGHMGVFFERLTHFIGQSMLKLKG